MQIISSWSNNPGYSKTLKYINKKKHIHTRIRIKEIEQGEDPPQCAYHVPPAGSFSPARARILCHACSTNAGQSGEDVFASLDGWHTCIPYPTVVSLRNCGTPLLGPTFSTCTPPTSTVDIVFEGPTMPHQLYKESLPFDLCSLSYSSAQVQKWHVLPQHPKLRTLLSDSEVRTLPGSWHPNHSRHRPIERAKTDLSTTSGSRDIACLMGKGVLHVHTYQRGVLSKRL
jgi:hypothetical protein